MTIDDLRIEPKFRDLIPKLTDAEFSQLEKNILEDGRVKEPIIVWNGIIVDGHHRYYILQMHPEIPYTIEEREFANEHAAMSWACDNQLGRRNLKDLDRDYLIGKRYQEEKLAYGSNQYSAAGGENEDFRSRHYDDPKIQVGKTNKKLGKEYGIGSRTVERNEQYADGVDITDAVVPGMKDKILHGEIEVPKSVIQKIPKATPDIQRKAAIAISKGDIKEAREALENNNISGLHAANEIITYTSEDLAEEVSVNFQQYMVNIDSTLRDHSDVLCQVGCKDMIISQLNKIFNEEIEKVKEIYYEDFQN